MVVLAQALVVAWVHEEQPVTPVGLDVIHHRGPGSDAPLGTLPAEWLPQELGWPQVLRPDRQAVPAMPLGRDPAVRLNRLMLGAVSATRQGRASRMPTRPERL